MKISILIPSYLRPEALRNALTSISRQTLHGAEVVVAYRQTDYLTENLLKQEFCHVHKISVMLPGMVYAVNSGLEYIYSQKPDFVLILDDDVVLPEDYLERGLIFFSDQKTGGVSGRDLIDGIEQVQNLKTIVGKMTFYGKAIGNHHLGIGGPREVNFLKGCNLFFRADAMRDLFFNDELKGVGAQVGCDSYFCAEVEKQGWRLLYDPALKIHHFPAKRSTGDERESDCVPLQTLTERAHNIIKIVADHLSLSRVFLFYSWLLLWGYNDVPGLAQLIRRVILRRPNSVVLFVLVQKESLRQLFCRLTFGLKALPTTQSERSVLIMTTPVISKTDGQGKVNYYILTEAKRRGWRIILFADRVEGFEYGKLTHVRTGSRHIPSAFMKLLFRIWLVSVIEPLVIMREKMLGTRWITFHNGVSSVFGSDINAVHFLHSVHSKAFSFRSLMQAYHYIYSVFNRVTERVMLKKARHLIAVSDLTKSELIAMGLNRESIEVIANGVDLTEFFPGAKAIEKGVLSGIFVGDINSDRKNIDGVIRAMASLSGVTLNVFGKIKGSPYLNLALKLGVSDRVIFKGFTTRVAQEMRSADFFILPARYEPFGLVVLEAMACGLPLIVSSKVGCLDLLPKSTIVVEDVENTDEIASAIKKIIDCPSLREAMREDALFFSKRYSFDAVAKKYCDLIEQNFNGPTSSADSKAPPHLK